MQPMLEKQGPLHPVGYRPAVLREGRGTRGPLCRYHSWTGIQTRAGADTPRQEARPPCVV